LNATQSTVLLPWQVVILSICMTVMLRYRGHVGWNTSNIIVWLIILGYVDVNIMDLLQREHPEILAGIRVTGWDMEKVAFSLQKV